KAVFRIQADDDGARELAAHIGHELRFFYCFGTDDDVADSRFQVMTNGFRRADTAADLDRQLGESFGNRGHHFTIDRLSGKGAVEVDQMQAARALLHPLAGDSDRDIGEYGGVLHHTFAQTYALAVFEVDGGNNLHEKFSIS